MRRLTRDNYVFELSRENPPAYTLEDGETVVAETKDALVGYMGRDGTEREGRPGANPATGPIEVKGSEPGEALAVTLHEVTTEDWGYIAGGDDDVKATIIEMREGIVHYPWGLRLPLNPVVGVIGVAPPGEPVPTTTPCDSGGNLDTTDVRAGATVYLPVAVPGAMLVIGDVHALQGDSECCGTGIECDAEITFTVRRVKDPIWHTTYLVRDDRLMVFSHSKDLDEAAWGAVAEMAKLLAKLTGLSEVESRRLLATAGDIRISQIVNPKRTCRAVIPREAIPDHWPF